LLSFLRGKNDNKHGKEKKRMHACASFKIEDFNKDYHVQTIWVIMQGLRP